MTSVAGSGLQISAQAAENTAPWAPSSENVKYSAHRPRRYRALGDPEDGRERGRCLHCVTWEVACRPQFLDMS